MPWKKSDGTIVQIGKSWVDDNKIRHPSNWNIWTDDYKKSMGLTWEDPPASENPFDNKFYWGRNTDGSLIEKNLDDEDAKDQDGKQLYEVDGKTKVINKGLKTVWIEKTKQTAQVKLNKHDWMIIRKSEKETAIPSNVTTYRDAVRTKCASIETAINNCSSHADFMKLFDLPSDGSNPPIFDFPDEI